MERKPFTVRVARWSAEHPWRAMALWVVFVIAAIAVGSAVGTKEATNGGNVAETARAQQMIEAGDFPDDPATERVLVTSKAGALDTAKATAALTDAATRMRALPEVAGVGDPVTSPDGTTMFLPVTVAGDPDTAEDRVQPLLDTTAALQAAHADVRVEQVGNASINKALSDTIGEDFKRAELFSVPVTLIILLVAFGALIAAGVPVLLAMSAVGAAIGLSALASHLVPAQEATNSVVLLIGMAVGVDYSLFYLKREREERAKGAGHLDAVEIAAATSGHAVVISGLAVIIAMSGMFLAQDNIFSSFAVGSILVVAVSVLGSLTVLPAMLAKLGRWVDRPRIPFVWRLTAPRVSGGEVTSRFWSVILRPALRAPWLTLILSVGALLALAAPALGMTLKLNGLQDVPRSTEVMQAYDRLTKAFPSTGTSHVVVVRAEAGQQAAVDTALGALAARTASDPLFAHDQEPKLVHSPNGTVTMLEIGTPVIPGTKHATESLDRLRDDYVPATLAGFEHAVTGEIAGTTDYSAHVKEKLPLVVGFVLLLTLLVMAWTFRSVVVALTSIALNLLSVGAAYGLLVLVFQHTWAEGLLDFTSNGGIISWLPIFLFVVLFGLSMDYHVFVVSRIREARLAGAANRDAVARGITSSAGVVTSAAVVMVAVFAIFGTLSTLDMKQLGVGLAAAILLDATIIRAVVLPSIMTLLGDANWWGPAFLRRRGTRGAAAPQVAPAPTPDRDPVPVG
ncbi:MMPL family transporter [Luedemannella helvata]|uniref:MMPL family transporter n=1 Tax=Luedemannella helvata TaxID=349315 RepID=A0ABP4XE05_9ACTN